MLLVNQEVFDEIITGTATTWYTPASQNAVIGLGDNLLILAHPSGLAFSPLLTAYLDTSSDNQHWILGTAFWSSLALSEGTVVSTWFNTGAQHAFARIRMTLNSSTAQCRLKISVTGRSM